MKNNQLKEVEILREDVEHLKSEAMRAHRRHLASGTEASYRLYKRLSSVWLQAKQKYDSQLAAKSQGSLF